MSRRSLKDSRFSGDFCFSTLGLTIEGLEAARPVFILELTGFFSLEFDGARLGDTELIENLIGAPPLFCCVSNSLYFCFS
jgi:hypothetical protein